MKVGIDLGTTNSAVAYIDENGNPQIIPNREGERITPSVILFEGGTPVVGSSAKTSATGDPLNVVQFVKRQIGNSSYRFINEQGATYSSEEISAIILKRLKEDAEMLLGQTIEGAVITVPAYFDDAQRNATKDAGAIAGLNVLKIINEPTAAALAYGLSKTHDTINLMVYDLGGGTFDITIMNISNGVIDIKATGGKKNLGGFDFDNNVAEWIISDFKKAHGIDLYDDLYALEDLREKTEACKKQLTTRTKALLTVSSQGKVLKTEITRDLFNELNRNLINQTGFLMNMVLDDAGMTWQEIDKILLVGGSTRMPIVHEFIEEITGLKPSIDVNPDEAVAIGAAMQASFLDQDGSSPVNPVPVIMDVNAHSLGIIASNKDGKLENTIILKRNTHIPAEVSREFYTAEENQSGASIQIAEGEDTDPEYVRIIGSAHVKLPPRPKNSPIRVVMSYDSNGIIHVFVYDGLTNENLGESHIDRKSNLSQDEIYNKKKLIDDVNIE